MQFIDPSVFCFLLLYVFADFILIFSDCGHKVAPSLEALVHEVPLVSRTCQCNVNSTLALDKTYYLGHRIFRWNRNQHMNMVWHKVTFNHPALFLYR